MAFADTFIHPKKKPHRKDVAFFILQPTNLGGRMLAKQISYCHLCLLVYPLAPYQEYHLHHSEFHPRPVSNQTPAAARN